MFYPMTDCSESIIYDQAKCFQTVTYYHSNPEVTGRGTLYYTYKNDNFKIAKFNLSCLYNLNSNAVIQIESVQLLLPATIEDYCLEASRTDFDECPSVSPCDCCEVPESICTNLYTRNYSYCNGRQECELYVRSSFLVNCSGREYGCDKEKCHSRWARVSYTCREVDQGTAEMTGTVGTTRDTTTCENTGNFICILFS